MLALTLSGDGRDVFYASSRGILSSRFDIYHCRIEGDQPGEPQRVPRPENILFGLFSSHDGSRLSAMVDGKPEGDRWPGWRAVAVISRGADGWPASSLRLLTPAEDGRVANAIFLSGDGRSVFYLLDDRPFRATQKGTDWVSEPVALAELKNIKPRAVSADGRCLLLRAVPAAAPRSVPGMGNLYWTQWTGDHWMAPTLIALDKNANVANERMSGNGQRMAWTHYTRNGNHIERTELCHIQKQPDGWSKPVTVLLKDAYVQVLDLAISDGGVTAYSLASGTEEMELLLDVDRGAEEPPINISRLVDQR